MPMRRDHPEKPDCSCQINTFRANMGLLTGHCCLKIYVISLSRILWDATNTRGFGMTAGSNMLLLSLRFLAFSALAAASSTGVAGPCTMQMVDIPFTMDGRQPLVAVSINGHDVNMLLDTGASKSMIWRSSAKALDLTVSRVGVDVKMYGVDGKDTSGIVMIRDFRIKSGVAHNIEMLAAGGGDAPGKFVGLLGENVISTWDIDFDFSAGKVRRFEPKDCQGEQVVSIWGSTNYSVLPLVAAPPGSDLIWARVQIDGHPALAMFDTGASGTIVTSAAVRRLGLKAETQIESAGVGHGIANTGMKTSIATFGSLSIGQETIQNVQLRVADLFSRNLEVVGGSAIAQAVMDTPDLLIGADFFLAHHVYLARSQDKIYFSYKGGPIFQGAPKPVEPAKDAEAKDAAPTQ
jgi:predicted aspartyl protease